MCLSLFGLLWNFLFHTHLSTFRFKGFPFSLVISHWVMFSLYRPSFGNGIRKVSEGDLSGYHVSVLLIPQQPSQAMWSTFSPTQTITIFRKSICFLVSFFYFIWKCDVQIQIQVLVVAHYYFFKTTTYNQVPKLNTLLVDTNAGRNYSESLRRSRKFKPAT